MLLKGRALSFSNQTITISKGPQAGQALKKTRLHLQDVGEEVAGELISYWADFLGEYALTDVEAGGILRQEVTVEVRLVRASAGANGKAYLNISGGYVYKADGKGGEATVQGTGSDR